MVRIGHGYDVHRLVEGRRLVLCGVDIEYARGLDGHSDADVAVHALIDALLGAAAMGDIGKHFPDNDDRYKNISSLELLKKVLSPLSEKDYTFGNADITIIAQEPKLLPYIEQMRENLRAVLGTELENINVKATTEEKLGFTGLGLGISAHAVVLLNR